MLKEFDMLSACVEVTYFAAESLNILKCNGDGHKDKMSKIY